MNNVDFINDCHVLLIFILCVRDEINHTRNPDICVCFIRLRINALCKYIGTLRIFYDIGF